MFGDSSVKSRNPVVDLWLNPPTYDDAKEAFTKSGQLEAQIKLLKRKIEKTEQSIRGGSRKAEDISNAQKATEKDKDKLAELEAELCIADSIVDWLNYHKDIAKMVGYAVK